MHRPEVTRDLKARLLPTGPTEPGVLALCALQGMGGIGKSTLAAALAHDPEVQDRFPDGVLWATLGQQPDILPLLSGWVQALGDYQFKPLVVEIASAHLRSLLQDKAALIVVDDVWAPAHVPPFLVGGPSCRVLITTRRATVADVAGAGQIPLGVLTPEQSLVLLAYHLGRDLGPAERDDARQLAEAVGFLPLALELAAVRVRRGVSWTELRRALEAEVARLEELEDPLRRRKGQAELKASFNYSLRALRAEDQAAYEAFAGLGLLPEDSAIAAPMAATLWEVEEAEADVLLEILWSESLLLPGAPARLDERTLRAYRFHDLLHDLARRLLIDPPGPTRPADLPGLGLTLREAHGRLLERYRARTRGGLWHTLPDDGYIHAHLTWHLEQAGAPEGLHGLLREETAEGRNGWYEARERLGQVAGYLSDVDRAWRLAEEAFADREAPIAIGLQCRYALIVTSLCCLAGNIHPALLSALVKNRMRSGPQGLAYARQVQNHEQRSESLAAVAPYLNPAEQEQAFRDALEAARAIGDEEARSRALTALVPYLTEPWLRGALEAARAIGDEKARSGALAALAPHLVKLSPETLYPLWNATLQLAATHTRADLLSDLRALVPVLAARGGAEAVAETCRAIRDVGRWWP